jgi:hypothetical protein
VSVEDCVMSQVEKALSERESILLAAALWEEIPLHDLPLLPEQLERLRAARESFESCPHWVALSVCLRILQGSSHGARG